jgi:hypothetical protein
MSPVTLAELDPQSVLVALYYKGNILLSFA